MTTVHPVPLPRRLPPSRAVRLSTAVARRALPVLAGSAAAFVATLAAERAIRELALGAIERLGGEAAGSPRDTTDIIRTVFTEVTVVERILRRA